MVGWSRMKAPNTRSSGKGVLAFSGLRRRERGFERMIAGILQRLNPVIDDSLKLTLKEVSRNKSNKWAVLQLQLSTV